MGAKTRIVKNGLLVKIYWKDDIMISKRMKRRLRKNESYKKTKGSYVSSFKETLVRMYQTVSSQLSPNNTTER